MLKPNWTRRGLLGAGLLALAAVVGGAGFGSAGDAPEDEGPAPAPTALVQPAEAPLDKPLVRFQPKGWSEIQDSVVVHFSAVTKSNKALTAEVTLSNRGDKALKGPVRIVIDDLKIEGLALKNGNGKLSNGAVYIDILAKGKSLAADKSTSPRKMNLTAAAEPAAAELEAFSPAYRVLVPATENQANAQAGLNSNKFTQQDLDNAMKSQNALSDQLMSGPNKNKDIFGTGTSIDENGNLYISVYSRIADPADVPKQKDGLPVKVELKGPFFPQYEGPQLEPIPAQEGKPQAGLYTDNYFSRPVPLGVAIGNEGACGWVGTLGARTSKGSSIYLMSNYHVLVPNATTITAVRITQPAICTNVASYRVGTLALYYPITFNTSANNRYDAAWGSTTTSLVSTRVPAGYGTLGSVTAPTLGMYVQKYGRTTQFTQGYISSVNVTSNIGYSQGTARFIGLVMIKPTAGYSSFSAGGDSGSLIVKQGTNQPTALLFAGSGSYTLACPLPGLLDGAGMTVQR